MLWLSGKTLAGWIAIKSRSPASRAGPAILAKLGPSTWRPEPVPPPKSVIAA